jgi:predicted unusual protein kinase regulating ubiquinone biosynthesis (AarF/ABC1/UbiB family)
MLMNMSTSRVLTMEYLPGIKVSDKEGLQRAGFSPPLLARRLAESYLLQLCQHGFFHCDPHPGNLAVDGGHPGGRVIYYDFGMMADLSPSIRKNFVGLVLAMYDNNVQAAYDAFYQLGVIDKAANQDDIKKVLTVFVEEFNALVYTSSGIYTSELSREEQELLVRKRRLKLGAELWVKLEKQGLFKLPATFSFIARAFNCLDGVGKALDPRYDLFKVAQPFVSGLVQAEAGVSGAEIQFWRSSAGAFLRGLGVGRSQRLLQQAAAPWQSRLQQQEQAALTDLKESVASNGAQLRRLVLQQNVLMKLGKTSFLLLLFGLGDKVGLPMQPSTKLSTLSRAWTGLQGTAVAVGVSKLAAEAVRSSLALNKIESMS